ncbi:MAG: hypothetical protein NXI31_23185 [bacterium]|nr:hypothetical protein [bacterium]
MSAFRILRRAVRFLVAVVCAGLVAGGAAGLVAQSFPRVSASPPPYKRPPWPENNHPRGNWGHRPSLCTGSIDAVLEYWQWNRDAYLPRPHARIGAVGDDLEPTTGVTPLDWLVEVARSGASVDRAGALLVIGGLGPGFGGRLAIERALSDDELVVRQAALLALGEHGGAAARFRLARELADPSQEVTHRRLAALAFGVASAVDGGRGGRALRPFAAAATGGIDRAFACVADDLAGGFALERAALSWLLDKSAARDEVLHGASIAHLVRSPRDAALTARLTTLVGSRVAPVRLAARVVLARDTNDAEVLRRWVQKLPKVGASARSLLALAAHPLLPEVATPLMQRSSQRPAAILALGVHARQRDAARARAVLRPARMARKTFQDRPLWLLADALMAVPGTAARAVAVLRDVRTPEVQRLAAIDVHGLLTGSDRAPVRRAIHLDPSPAVRLRAADVLARHGQNEDLAALRHAVDHAGTPEERAGLLVALGRSRSAVAERELERWCRGKLAKPVERAAAWRGLLLCVRRGGASALARLPHGVAYAYLPGSLLRLVALHR